MRRELIRDLARLAGLEVPEGESGARLAEELGRVVEWFDSLPDEPDPDAGAPASEALWRSATAEGPEPPARTSDRLLAGEAHTEDGWIVVPAIRPRTTDEE